MEALTYPRLGITAPAVKTARMSMSAMIAEMNLPLVVSKHTPGDVALIEERHHPPIKEFARRHIEFEKNKSLCKEKTKSVFTKQIVRNSKINLQDKSSQWF